MDGWDPVQLLEAVRTGVPSVLVEDANEVPIEVALDDQDLLVTFHWPDEPNVIGIRFPTSAAPLGPSTGEVCETPAEWAQEVGCVLWEELGSGAVRWGRRTQTPSGVVELDYRRGETGSALRVPPNYPDPPPGHHYRVSFAADGDDSRP